MTPPRRPRFRLWPLSTAILVLVALGTPGFAVAVLAVIVGEAAAPTFATHLVAIERVRGVVQEALAR